MRTLGPRHKPFFRIGRYRRGVAAYVANRSRVPFAQCLDIVEWNWPILVDAYDAGERFQDAGTKILAAMRAAPPSRGRSQGDSRRPARQSQGVTNVPRQRPRPARRAASSAAT
jgi:hypothetical protein